MNSYYVYIMASDSGTLYTGFTNNLIRRVFEHREALVDGFTKKYGCHKLVYFEQTSDVNSAIAREKQKKNWHREKREALIKTMSPRWEDLYKEVLV